MTCLLAVLNKLYRFEKVFMLPKEDVHFSNAELKDFIALTNPQQIKRNIQTFSDETIMRFFQELGVKQRKKDLDLAISAIETLEETAKLEAIGKGMNHSFFLSLFNENIKKRKKPLYEKLSPILVGLTPSVFKKTLQEADEKQIRILKQECVAEPMHHHLLLLAHEIENENRHFLERFSSIQKEVENLSFEEMSFDDLKRIQDKIHTLSLYYEDTLLLLDKALAIAWNTNRPDLIDQLTIAKEAAQRQNLLGVGEKSDVNYAPYSLKAFLKNHLESLYGKQKNLQESPGLQDEDLAIEGLVKFSLWYISDYVAIGLLPPLEKKEEDLSPEEKQMYVHNVQENLQKINLVTIKDLKKENIFSKKMLKEYIQNHLHF